MRSASKNSALAASRGLFQHLLDRLATRAEPPPPDRVEPRLAVRLAQTRPRFIVPSAALYDDDGLVETVYAQHAMADEPIETRGDVEPTAAPPLAARAAALREKVLSARSQDEVKQLRRVGARLLHPDVSPAHERAAAEKIMAELNAIIDAALRAGRSRP